MKASTKIAILGANSLLGWKLYSILKREYSIIGLQSCNKIDELQLIDFNDDEQICAFLNYHKIETLIITSERLLDGYEKDFSFNLFLKLHQYCKSHTIKIVYISIFYPLIVEDNGRVEIAGITSFMEYGALNRKLSDMFSEEKNLIISCSTTYGFNEYATDIDFTQAMRKCLLSDTNLILDNNIQLFPVLTDELAIHVSNSIRLTGMDTLFNHSSCTTLYNWALLISNFYCADSKLISKKSECFCDTSDDFNFSTEHELSSLEEGLNIITKQASCSFNVVYKFNPVDQINGISIAKHRIEMGKKLLESVPHSVIESLDYVIPVPKTGIYYALGFAEAARVPFMESLIKDTNRIRSFHILNSDMRKEILWDKIKPIQELIQNKTVAIIDEAIFTGTTLKIVCEMLHQCNVKGVYLCIPTPECKFHCDYYVHPKLKMLLEYIREDMLIDYFDVQGVYFLNKEHYVSSMNTLNAICAECFLGRERNY